MCLFDSSFEGGQIDLVSGSIVDDRVGIVAQELTILSQRKLISNQGVSHKIMI